MTKPRPPNAMPNAIRLTSASSALVRDEAPGAARRGGEQTTCSDRLRHE